MGNPMYKPCGDSAQKWAEFFEQSKQKNGWKIEDINEDLMVGWFANAIETACDYRSQPPTSTKE